MTCGFFFFFNDTATTEIYTLSLHDALPISRGDERLDLPRLLAPERRRPLDPERHQSAPHGRIPDVVLEGARHPIERPRSEEHTSELQSPCNLVCRLLLEKKQTECASCDLRP